MSEFPSPPVTGNAAVNGQEALTPEAIEAVLADFRSWLQQMAAQPPAEEGSPAGGHLPCCEAAEPLDLHTLLAQFVAVRHEVNLQTKAVRAQQEQNAEALQQLEQALEALQEVQASARQADQQEQDELLRPLLKTLVDTYDALALAGREVQRVQEAAVPLLTQLAAETEPTAASALLRPEATQSLWSKWFGDGGKRVESPVQEPELAAQQERETARRVRQRQATEQVRHLLDSVLTGYAMSVRRVERALQEYGLEAIPCVGEPFDPEFMEVVEVVADPARSSAEVIAEVRRGYLWRGRVFRYAQVRVARPSVP
jgi:molecular chaperone GrpE